MCLRDNDLDQPLLARKFRVTTLVLAEAGAVVVVPSTRHRYLDPSWSTTDSISKTLTPGKAERKSDTLIYV